MTIDVRDQSTPFVSRIQEAVAVNVFFRQTARSALPARSSLLQRQSSRMAHATIGLHRDIGGPNLLKRYNGATRAEAPPNRSSMQ